MENIINIEYRNTNISINDCERYRNINIDININDCENIMPVGLDKS